MPESSQPPPSTMEPVKKVRRFAPLPVEESTRSRKKENDMTADPNRSADTNDSTERKDFAPKKRVLPTPVETTFKSNKQPANALPTPEHTPVFGESKGERELPAETKPRRPRFAPQLIESSKRSKKAGDAAPATLPTDKVRFDSSCFDSCNFGGFQRHSR